jgi:hypothetical protein
MRAWDYAQEGGFRQVAFRPERFMFAINEGWLSKIGVTLGKGRSLTEIVMEERDSGWCQLIFSTPARQLSERSTGKAFA